MIILDVVIAVVSGSTAGGLIYSASKRSHHVFFKDLARRSLVFVVPSFIEPEPPKITEETPKPPPSPNKSIVDMVCDLLIMNKDWTVGPHYASHPTGVSMWVANGGSCLGLRLGGENAWPHKDSDPLPNQLILTLDERLEIWNTFQATQIDAFGAADLSAAIIRRYGTEEDIDFLNKTSDLLERSRRAYRDSVISQLPRYGGDHDSIGNQQVG